MEELPGLAPPPDVEEIELYGQELNAILDRLHRENRYIAVLKCDRRSYKATVYPLPPPPPLRFPR